MVSIKDVFDEIELDLFLDEAHWLSHYSQFPCSFVDDALTDLHVMQNATGQVALCFAGQWTDAAIRVFKGIRPDCPFDFSVLNEFSFLQDIPKDDPVFTGLLQRYRSEVMVLLMWGEAIGAWDKQPPVGVWQESNTLDASTEAANERSLGKRDRSGGSPTPGDIRRCQHAICEFQKSFPGRLPNATAIQQEVSGAKTRILKAAKIALGLESKRPQ